MRAVPLALLPLATPALAGPPERAEPGRPLPSAEPSILTLPGAEEAPARQVAFDRRIAERSNRAARSICSGCGTGPGPRGATVAPGLRRHQRDEARPAGPFAAAGSDQASTGTGWPRNRAVQPASRCMLRIEARSISGCSARTRRTSSTTRS